MPLAFPSEPSVVLIHENSIEMIEAKKTVIKIRHTSGPPLPIPLDAEPGALLVIAFRVVSSAFC